MCLVLGFRRNLQANRRSSTGGGGGGGLVLTSLLRTIIPYGWGHIITWLVTVLPVLEPLENNP